MMAVRHSKSVTRGSRWRFLRFEALRRAGFKCQSCGARGRLEVDHVRSVQVAPELAFDLKNLQVLCPSCHTRKTYAEITGKPPNEKRMAWRNAVQRLERSGK